MIKYHPLDQSPETFPIIRPFPHGLPSNMQIVSILVFGIFAKSA